MLREDYDLAKLLFDAYINSFDYEEWHIKLNEKIKETHKERVYLVFLVDLYVRQCANAEEKIKYYNAKKRIKQQIKYQIVIDELLEMNTDEERFNYLMINKIERKDLILYIIRYIKQNDNNDACYKILSFLTQYEFNVQKSLEKEDEKKKKVICELFSSYIDKGICDFVDCKYYLAEDLKITINEAEQKISSYRGYLKRVDRTIYNDYKKQFEENKKKLFEELRENIQQLFSNINNSDFSIIDYYLLIGMRISRFKRLYYDYLDLKQRSAFNKKFPSSIYECEESKNVARDKAKLVDFDFGNGKVDMETKEKVLLFMDEYNIPYCWLGSALKKYCLGKLDFYFNSESFDNAKTL